MLPISLSAGRPSSLPGSTPSSPHSAAASAGVKSISTMPSRSPTIAEHDGGDRPARGRPTASTASASGSARAFGTEMSTGAADHASTARVPAVPEPMLASSRRASSCRSE